VHGGDEARAISWRGLVMRLMDLPGLLGITPVSMEPSDDPIDVLTKSGSTAVAVGTADPSTEVIRTDWLLGSEKWTTSMDDASTEGPQANSSDPSIVHVSAHVETCTRGDRSGMADNSCLGAVMHVDVHGPVAGPVHSVHGSLAGPGRTIASLSNNGSSAVA
jgi:hypothetical protein